MKGIYDIELSIAHGKQKILYLILSVSQGQAKERIFEIINVLSVSPDEYIMICRK